MRCLCIMVFLLSAIHGMRGDADKSNTGLTRHSIQWAGLKRQYLQYLPNKSDDRPFPLLFCLHGGGGTAHGMIRLTGNRFNELADSQHFMVIYPQGVGKSWNDGRVGDFSTASTENIDDVGFIRAIILQVCKEYRMDTSRIFVTGISNGGFMTMRLACELSGYIRGAAPVAATMGVEFSRQCQSFNPVNILILNGIDDPLVPFQGGYVKVLRQTRGKIISTQDAVDLWVARNHCSNIAKTESLPDTNPEDGTTVIKMIYDQGETGTSVILYKINHGGHTWPGGRQYLGERIVGKTCRDIDACEEIWGFFSKATHY